MAVKILVVDDEPDLESLIRQKFRRQIRNEDYAFLFARNGVEALRTLDEHQDVDLVLTDINMPEMDGLTLLLHVGELKLLLKSVIVSAYGDMENIRVAMNRGAADFLTKPIDLADMEITVHKMVEEVRALKVAMGEHRQLLALRRELEIAADIQQSILPRAFPSVADGKGYALFGEMIPAREVGGDFYDFFEIDENRLGLVIADVSDKGVPAAIFMAVSRTLLKSIALQGLPPEQCLQHVNSLLCMENSEEMFVTIFYAILDTSSGEIVYSNGGHNPPYVLKGNKEVEALPGTGGAVLGVMDAIQFGAGRIVLQPGESLFLFTDGVTEAMDAANRLYGEAKLSALLQQVDRSTPEKIVRAVVEDVKQHGSGAPQTDDITMLVATFVPSRS